MLKAAGSYVIVEPVFEVKNEKIYIPAHIAKKEGDFYGVVVAVGPEYRQDKPLKVGESVLYRRNEGVEIEHDGKKFLALKEQWVLAVIE